MSNLFGSTMLTTTVMLIASNCFMTFAWYAHLKKSLRQALVYRGTHQLGHRVVRINADGAGQPHRLHHDVAWAIEDFAGSHHTRGIRAVRRSLHGRIAALELSVGGFVSDGRGVFYF